MTTKYQGKSLDYPARERIPKMMAYIFGIWTL